MYVPMLFPESEVREEGRIKALSVRSHVVSCLAHAKQDTSNSLFVFVSMTLTCDPGGVSGIPDSSPGARLHAGAAGAVHAGAPLRRSAAAHVPRIPRRRAGATECCPTEDRVAVTCCTAQECRAGCYSSSCQ